jgi:hypothetical protein
VVQDLHGLARASTKRAPRRTPSATEMTMSNAERVGVMRHSLTRRHERAVPRMDEKCRGLLRTARFARPWRLFRRWLARKPSRATRPKIVGAPPLVKARAVEFARIGRACTIASERDVLAGERRPERSAAPGRSDAPSKATSPIASCCASKLAAWLSALLGSSSLATGKAFCSSPCHSRTLS